VKRCDAILLKVFFNVYPDGPAYAAGLRDGMKRIERLGGEWGDSNVPVSFRVLDLDGKEQAITYLPQGRQIAVGQQLTITENLDEELLAKCVGSVAFY